MPVKYLDLQGNITTDINKAIKLAIDNPGGEGDFETNLPGQGELFRTKDGFLATGSGGNYTQFGGIPGLGTRSTLAKQNELLAQSGFDISQLREFDLGQFAGQLQRQGAGSIGEAGADVFGGLISNFAPQSGSTSASGLTNVGSTADALNINSAENQQARQDAAQRFGTTLQAAGFKDPVTGQNTPPGIGVPAEAIQDNPFAGIEAKFSGQLQSAEEAQEFKAAKSLGFTNEQSLQRALNLRTGGPLGAEQGTRTDNRATLTSPTGEKKVVIIGSQEASQLLSSGYTLGDKLGGGTEAITTATLTPENGINIGNENVSNQHTADIGTASAKATADAVDEIIKRDTPPETTESKQLEELFAALDPDSLTGRGASQLEAERQRGIEEKNAALASKNTELKAKLAEINALTASYNQANQMEEGRPQTLSRLQGAQARNYKMYIAQKNGLAADAGILQAELLGMQGELNAAQNAADRAVDLMYMDRESAYNAQLAKINILIPQVDKQEKAYASALKTVLDRQADALAEKKSWMKTAVSAGIFNSSVLKQIENSGSFAEAMQLIGDNKPAKSTGGGSGGGIKVSSTQKTILQRVFPASEIEQVAQDINDYGVARVLEGITDPAQARAIQEAYGGDLPKPTELDVKGNLADVGWPAKAIRAYQQEQADSNFSIDPTRWRLDNEELFDES